TDAFKKKIFDDINSYRAAHGKTPVTGLDGLDKAADAHAQMMSTKTAFGHDELDIAQWLINKNDVYSERLYDQILGGGGSGETDNTITGNLEAAVYDESRMLDSWAHVGIGVYRTGDSSSLMYHADMIFTE
ncbi:MAG TPA: CAP domain-containing protein, partial [Anaerovoracaceae bacterium]|nr:CAP domain-containing protein [Anaerovoracaceae bacterium]